MEYYGKFTDEYLAHHGILGMHWGVRRYQNPDGSLTPAGRQRYRRKLEKRVKRVASDLKKGKSVKDKSALYELLDYNEGIFKGRVPKLYDLTYAHFRKNLPDASDETIRRVTILALTRDLS